MLRTIPPGRLFDRSFKLSRESLRDIATKTNALPVGGYVHENNIPLFFSSEQDAQLFFNFLQQNYADRFDWSKVEPKRRAETNSFVVDLMGLANKKALREIFILKRESPLHRANLCILAKS